MFQILTSVNELATARSSVTIWTAALSVAAGLGSCLIHKTTSPAVL